MKERLTYISKLLVETKARAAYIKAKLGVLVPSQIRALRLKSDMPRQSDLARAAGMQQSRISMFETPGAANVTLETLAWLAAIFKVGLIVKFVPFSEMLRWENTFSQDDFSVTKINDDRAFLEPPQVVISEKGITIPVPSNFTIEYPHHISEIGAASDSGNYGQLDRVLTGLNSHPFYLAKAGSQTSGQKMWSAQCA